MRRVRGLLTMVVAAAAVIVSMGANAAYTQHVADLSERHQAEIRVLSDRRWCELFALLDPAGAPPTTERGRLVQEQIRRLRAEFRCAQKP